ncbi:MAG: LptF/LptG family permease, partial [Bacteroidota bacterium]
MKTIDRLLLRSFIPPFVVTFFIAMFVLIMQFLWTYIDDIIGKGAGLWILMELIFYLSMSLIPTALPIAVLISSVMVMGNLAERYELASLKSAGVPLLRVMKPLMFFMVGISMFSYFCSNNLIPLANLKFKSRLYDIRKQKPTLSLEEGVFNDDFKGFVIHIGEKGADNRSISDVLIYDTNNYNRGKPSMILADHGEMFMTNDKRYFVMNLFKGTQYRELQESGTGEDKTLPFVRTSFNSWTKVFDLSEFDLNRTDEDLFKSHQSMLSTAQLRLAIDSLDDKIHLKLSGMDKQIAQYFYYSKDTVKVKKIERKVKQQVPPDSLAKEKVLGTASKTNQKPAQNQRKTAVKTEKKVNHSPSYQKQVKAIEQKLDREITAYDYFYETLPRKERIRLFNKAKSFARSIHGHSETTLRALDRVGESRVKHVFELNIKFSMAVVCFIFLFIGAPMGAIVRKGGFGYPILIAIIFFMLFIVLN